MQFYLNSSLFRFNFSYFSCITSFRYHQKYRNSPNTLKLVPKLKQFAALIVIVEKESFAVVKFAISAVD